MKALVLGGGADQCSLIIELKRRGLSTILVDYHETPPAKDLVDKHYVVSTLDHKAVLDIAQAEAVEVVVTACIDQALLTVAYVSEQLGLFWPFSHQQALKTTNKALMKQVFNDYGIATANFQIVDHQDDPIALTMPYPVVVKPVDSNGSFGVKRVDTAAQLPPAVSDALQISRSRTAIVEQYIAGTEVSIDAFVCDRRVHILLLTETKKYASTGSGFPISQSQYPVDLSEDVLLKIERAVNDIVAAFELKNTPLLVQVVVRDSDVFVLEFGARIAGGSKHHLIKYVTGFDVMSAFIDTLFHHPVQIETFPCHGYVATNYVYAHPGVFHTVVGMDAMLRDNTVVTFIQYKTPGMKIASCRASRDRVGAFIVKADTRAELHEKIDLVNRRMKVLDPTGNDIMLHLPWLESSGVLFEPR